MRVVLHIGTHKTGTSSFQTWLRQNAPALRGAGVLPLPLDQRFFDRSVSPEGVDPIADALSEARAIGAACILVSHETLSQNSEEEFRRLRRRLDGCAVTVVVAFRSLCSFLPSRWAQNCRRRDGLAFPDFIAAMRAQPDLYFDMRHDLILRRLRAAGFDRIRVLSYDESLATGGILPLLAKTCIPAAPEPAQRLDINVSPPWEQTEVIRLFNALRAEHCGVDLWPMGKGKLAHLGHFEFYDHAVPSKGLFDKRNAPAIMLLDLVVRRAETLTLTPEVFEEQRRLLADAVGDDGVNESGVDIFATALPVHVRYCPLGVDDLPEDLKVAMAGWLARTGADFVPPASGNPPEDGLLSLAPQPARRL